MADTLSADRPSSQWLKTSLQVGAILLLTWGCAIWYWRVTDRVPDTSGLIVTLLVLPLALIGMTQVGKALVSRSRPAVAAAAQPATAQAPVGEEQTAPMMTILATTAHVPSGANSEELAAAFAQNKVRPEVDKRLLDNSGFPVVSHRSNEGVDESLQEEVSTWLAQNGTPEPQFSEEQWRALVLGTSATRDLTVLAVRHLLPAADSALALRLIPLLPADWTVDQRRLASRWLMHAAVQCGLPASRISMDETAAPSSASAVFSQLQQQSPSGPVTAIVIGCASNIGQQTVDQWDASRMLFTSTNPRGEIPGEGASGLLITNADQKLLPGGPAVARFHLSEQLIHAGPANRNKPDFSPLLKFLVEGISKQLAVPLAEVAMVVTDAGEQPARTLEVMQMAHALLPQLDASTDVVRAGTACGTCGDVPLITAINLACHFAAERQAPVLCIGTGDPSRRSVALVRPLEAVVA